MSRKHPDQSNRIKLIRAYIDNMCAYLKLTHPDQSDETIFQFVDDYVKTNIQRPKIKLIRHPNYGDAEIVDVDLLSYTNNIGDRIITPSGSIYMPSEETPSLMKLKILSNIAARKAEKTIMLQAAAKGETVTEQRAHYKQASIKIETNSISGAMANPYNCLFDIPGYNAITSVGRHSVMSGYARVEQFLEGNFYFPDVSSVINYVIQLHRVKSDGIMNIISKYNLHIPTVDDVCTFIYQSTQFYMRKQDIEAEISEFVKLLPLSTRVFFFYANCFRNLIIYNDQFMRDFFGTLFTVDSVIVNPEVDPKKIFKTDEELLAMVLSLNSECIEHEKLDEAIKKFPDGVRRLIAIAEHMQAKIDTINDLIHAFYMVKSDTPDTMSHANMIRKAVIVSDTDSVIMSTQSLVVWYNGKVSFDKPAYEINAFAFYLISHILKHVFTRVSIGIGVTGEDVNRIAMKNEYMYPLFFRTTMAKHYIGLITVQEGNILPKPKLDIKGVELRGSTLGIETRDNTEEFIKWLFNEIQSNGFTTARECISKNVEHEMRVYNSIIAGEKTFLTTSSIKLEKEYVDASTSNFFYYKLWEEVFASKFGTFVIPNKGYSFSVLGDGAAIRSETYLESVKKLDKDIYERLVTFLERWPKKKISTIIMPPTIGTTPDILKPLIDLRKIMYSNGRPGYLLLRSLGIGLTNSEQMLLCSDFYDINGIQIAR